MELSVELPYLFDGLAGLVGLAAIAFGIWTRRKSVQATSWPSVEGMILESKVTGAGDNRSLRIRYCYTVAGQTFESGQFNYSGIFSGTEDKIADRYPRGRTVSVYYDPAAPASAVLENQQSLGWLFIVAIGAAFLAFAIWSLW